MNIVPPKSWLEHDAVWWRRAPGAHWRKGNVVAVLNDKDGSVKIHDSKGWYGHTLNDPAHLKER